MMSTDPEAPLLARIAELEAALDRVRFTHGELTQLVAACARDRDAMRASLAEREAMLHALSTALERADATDPSLLSSFRASKRW